MRKGRTLFWICGSLAVATAVLLLPMVQIGHAAVKKEIDITLTKEERERFETERLKDVLKQAIDMQFSDEMVDEVAKLFQVRYRRPKRVSIYSGGRDVMIERIKRNRPVDRIIEIEREPTVQSSVMPEFGGSGDRVSMEQGVRPGSQDPSAGIQFGGDGQISGVKPIDDGAKPLDPGTLPPESLVPGWGDARSIESMPLPESIKKPLLEFRDKYNGVPMKEVRRVEGLINNAILDLLKEKGFTVAALGVYLHTTNEVKVILVVTSSSLPRSRIRDTLQEVRDLIETKVLAERFPKIKLAQLSSFTLLNEIENHFYEHAVLYWQMQLPGWELSTREIPISQPVAVGKAPHVELPREAPSTPGPRSEAPIPQPEDEEFDESQFLDDEAFDQAF